MFNFFIIILLTLFDLVTKYFVMHLTVDVSSIRLLPFLNIVYVRNSGIAFGLAGNFWIWIFISVNLVIFIFLLNLLIKEHQRENKKASFALALIISGGLGNSIDRIIFGSVFDFIDFHIFSFHWPAFNFADCFVVCGVFMLFLYHYLLIPKHESE